MVWPQEGGSTQARVTDHPTHSPAGILSNRPSAPATPVLTPAIYTTRQDAPQEFSSARSLSIAFSSSASAKSFLSRAFSPYSCVSRQASSACIPPYCCRQRWEDGCVTSITRQTSATVLPWAIYCSAVVSLRMIFSAVCLVRFMMESPAQPGRTRTLNNPGQISRVHVTISKQFRQKLFNGWHS